MTKLAGRKVQLTDAEIQEAREQGETFAKTVILYMYGLWDDTKDFESFMLAAKYALRELKKHGFKIKTPKNYHEDKS